MAHDHAVSRDRDPAHNASHHGPDAIPKQSKPIAARVQELSPEEALPVEEWTMEELYRRATELEVEGRAKMSREELIRAIQP